MLIEEGGEALGGVGVDGGLEGGTVIAIEDDFGLAVGLLDEVKLVLILGRGVMEFLEEESVVFDVEKVGGVVGGLRRIGVNLEIAFLVDATGSAEGTDDGLVSTGANSQLLVLAFDVGLRGESLGGRLAEGEIENSA